MKVLAVFVTVLAVALADTWHGGAWGGHGHGHHGGLPQDTPEVAAAKAAHFAALSQAGSPVPNHYAPTWNHGAHGAVPQDTPEVAAAKAAHFAAVARAGSAQPSGNWADHSGQWNGDAGQWNDHSGQWNDHSGQWNDHSGQWSGHNNYAPKWHGPLALPPGFDAHGAPLPVQDTPEVAAERANHFSLVAKSGGHAPAPAWNAGHNQWNSGAWNHAGHAGHGWAGHGHSALPQDTPEVAAAKAAHLAAHSQAAHAAPAAHHHWKRSAVWAAPAVHTVWGAPLVRSWGYSSHAVAPVWGSHVVHAW